MQWKIKSSKKKLLNAYSILKFYNDLMEILICWTQFDDLKLALIGWGSRSGAEWLRDWNAVDIQTGSDQSLDWRCSRIGGWKNFQSLVRISRQDQVQEFLGGK